MRKEFARFLTIAGIAGIALTGNAARASQEQVDEINPEEVPIGEEVVVEAEPTQEPTIVIPEPTPTLQPTPEPTPTQTPEAGPRLDRRVLFNNPIGSSGGGDRPGIPRFEFIPPISIDEKASEFTIEVDLTRMQGIAGFLVQNWVSGLDPASKRISIRGGDSWAISYFESGNHQEVYETPLPYRGSEGTIRVRFDKEARSGSIFTPNSQGTDFDLRGGSLFLPGTRQIGFGLWSVPNGQVTATRLELQQLIRP